MALFYRFATGLAYLQPTSRCALMGAGDARDEQPLSDLLNCCNMHRNLDKTSKRRRHRLRSSKTCICVTYGGKGYVIVNSSGRKLTFEVCLEMGLILSKPSMCRFGITRYISPTPRSVAQRSSSRMYPEGHFLPPGWTPNPLACLTRTSPESAILHFPSTPCSCCHM